MVFTQTRLAGACLIEIDRFVDERGFFARSWCSREFTDHQLPAEMKQSSISFNERPNTLRGMHFALAPCREGKLVRCTSGSILDVIIDLRPDSPSFLQHDQFELTAKNRNAVYIPPGMAHGFLTLESDTEVFYMMTEEYRPNHGAGFRWNDPAFGIEWPAGEKTMSDRDANYPDFDPSVVQGFAGYAEHERVENG